MSERCALSLNEEVHALRRDVTEKLVSWERQLAAWPQAVAESVVEAVETAEERQSATFLGWSRARWAGPAGRHSLDLGAGRDRADGLLASRPAERGGGRSGAVSPSVGRDDGGRTGADTGAPAVGDAQPVDPLACRPGAGPGAAGGRVGAQINLRRDWGTRSHPMKSAGYLFA